MTLQPSKAYGALFMGIPFLTVLMILAEAQTIPALALGAMYGLGCALFFKKENIENDQIDK